MKSILLILLCTFLLQESMQKPSRKMKLSLDSVEAKGLNRHALERFLRGKSGRLGCDDDIDQGENTEEDEVCLLAVFMEFLGILESDGDISVEDTAIVLFLLYFIDPDLAELKKCKETYKDIEKKCDKLKKYTDCVDSYLNSISV